MKKTALALTFISALLISTVAGDLLVNLAAANIYQTPPLTMSITVQSPENRVYTQGDVPLDFTVNIALTSTSAFDLRWHLSPSYFTYLLDGQPAHFSVSYSGSESSRYCSTTMSNLPEGPHNLKITVVAEIGDYGMATYRFGTKSVNVAFTVNAAAPRIAVLSFDQYAYDTSSLPLVFSVSESDISWMGYSLDGAATQTINGNTTLNGLSYGTHTIVVYATDMAGSQGTSQSTQFSVVQETQPQQETQPTTLQSTPFSATLIATSVVIVAIAVAGLLVYFVKVRRKTREQSRM